MRSKLGQNVLPSCFEESYGDLRQASPLAKTVLREAFLLGEELIIPGLNAVLGKALQLNEQDRSAGSLPSQIKAAAKRQAHTLPEDWKALISLHLVSSWAKKETSLTDEVLNTAALLFSKLNARFENSGSVSV